MYLNAIYPSGDSRGGARLAVLANEDLASLAAVGGRLVAAVLSSRAFWTWQLISRRETDSSTSKRSADISRGAICMGSAASSTASYRDRSHVPFGTVRNG